MEPNTVRLEYGNQETENCSPLISNSRMIELQVFLSMTPFFPAAQLCLFVIQLFSLRSVPVLHEFQPGRCMTCPCFLLRVSLLRIWLFIHIEHQFGILIQVCLITLDRTVYTLFMFVDTFFCSWRRSVMIRCHTVVCKFCAPVMPLLRHMLDKTSEPEPYDSILQRKCGHVRNYHMDGIGVANKFMCSSSFTKYLRSHTNKRKSHFDSDSVSQENLCEVTQHFLHQSTPRIFTKSRFHRNMLRFYFIV